MVSKKAAIELSMTTVVVVVLSVIMLIMGLTLIKTIACGAITIAADSTKGAQDQVNKMFGEEQGKEIACMGTQQSFTIIPGRDNVVGCGFNPEVETAYKYEYVLQSATIYGTRQDIKSQVMTWMPESLTGTVNAGPGDSTLAYFRIDPPKNAPRTEILFRLRVNGIDKDQLRFEVRSVGWVGENVC